MVGEQLAKNVKKCVVIPPGEVADLGRRAQLGGVCRNRAKPLKADKVVGLDLEQFSLYEGQTLYQGRADIHVWVYDMQTGGGHRAVWNMKLPQTLYPATAAVSISDKTEDAFRRDYLAVLSDHISRLFYEHERLVDFASDADSLK